MRLSGLPFLRPEMPGAHTLLKYRLLCNNHHQSVDQLDNKLENKVPYDPSADQ